MYRLILSSRSAARRERARRGRLSGAADHHCLRVRRRRHRRRHDPHHRRPHGEDARPFDRGAERARRRRYARDQRRRQGPTRRLHRAHDRPHRRRDRRALPKTSVDVLRDVQPVSVVGVTPLVLLVHKDVPVKDYASLVAYLKAHPNELTTASNGRGSAGHLAGALFKKMAGVDILYVPYRTTPQAQADLIGGRLSMMWLSTLTDAIRTGILRPIAVTTLERWKIFPDVPTFDELGLKGYEATTWVSMYLTKGAPQEATDKLTAALNAALADPAVQRAARPGRRAAAARHRPGFPGDLSQVRDRQVERDPAIQQGRRLKPPGERKSPRSHCYNGRVRHQRHVHRDVHERKPGGSPMPANKKGGRAPPALATVVRQSRQSGHDRALSRALSQFRPHARGTHLRPPDHRHRADRLRSLALQPASPRAGQARARGHPRRRRHRVRVPDASDPGDRQAADRRARPQPRLSRAWSRCCSAIRSTASCSPPAATRPRRPPSWRRRPSTFRRSCSRAARCSTAGGRASARAPAPRCGTRGRPTRPARSTTRASSRWSPRRRPRPATATPWARPRP